MTRVRGVQMIDRQAELETARWAPGKMSWPAVRRRLTPVVRHALLIAVGALFVLPFYWMVISSLKETTAVFTRPIVWFPLDPLWDNYPTAATYPRFPFLRFTWNSTYYAGLVMMGAVVSCAAVGYGFARLRFPGRTILFGITLATMMVPTMVTFIPTYVLFKTIGDIVGRPLIGTYVPLIAPAFFGNAFFIFMVRQFFKQLPWELTEAAKVDGASEFRIFWQIMLPLVRPSLMVVAVFTFLWTWHEFFGPLVYLSDNSKFPLSLGLFAFKARRTSDWGPMMAASVMATAPLIVVFFFTQRYFLQGVSLTGIKG